MIDERRAPSTIVIILDNANVDGGSAKVALSSADGLAKLGYDVRVISAVPATADTRAQLSSQIRFTATDQLEVLADPAVAKAALRGIWNAEAYRLTRELLEALDRRTTIVHVHGWTKALSSSVVRAALDARFVTAITLHEYFTICPIGSLFDHRRREICRRDPMSFDCITANCDSRSYAHKVYRVVRHVASQRFGGIPDRIRHFVSVSAFSRNVLESHLPSEARIYDVANPVDPPVTDVVDVARNDRFVFIGRLSPEKGPLLFAEAVRRLGARAIFAGAGELRDQILEILPDAEITGWLDRAGLAAVLRRARAIVVPSLWYETFGLVVLEAAAAGIPAIVADDCAARDLIVDNETGSTFRTGDVDDLERALRTYSDDAYVAELGRTTHRSYSARPFTIEAHTTSLAIAYATMLAS